MAGATMLGRLAGARRYGNVDRRCGRADVLLRERLFRGDEFSVDEPFAEAGGPGAGRGLIGFTQTETVAGAGVDVQLGGDAGAFETQIHFGETLGDIDAVSVAGGEKDGRRAFFRDYCGRLFGCKKWRYTKHDYFVDF